MVSDIAIFEDVAYLPRAEASIKLNVSPSSPVKKNPDKTNNIVASWGSDNLRPQKIFNALGGLPQVKQILQWQAKALVSGGIIYGKYDDNGEFVRAKDPVVEKFFRDTNITRFLLESAVDYYWFGNPFTEIILNGGRKVAYLVSQDSMFCRKGLQNKDGLVDKVFINTNWDESPEIKPADGIDCIDPYYDRVGQVKEGNKFKYIYCTDFPSPGKVYYQALAWHDLVESGWLEVAKAIPAFKKALFKNQISIKYHIEIADWYWSFRYQGEWETFSNDVKRTKIKETLKELEETLTGAENAGKTFNSWIRTGADGTTQESAIKVTALDDKIKSGVYIEDSQEAFSNILFSFGVDPTLPGNAPGKQVGGGSGSDKRVAYNIYLQICKPDADILLEPIYFTRDVNGWDEDYVFLFKNYYVATLDSGKEVSSTGTAANNAAA